MYMHLRQDWHSRAHVSSATLQLALDASDSRPAPFGSDSQRPPKSVVPQ